MATSLYRGHKIVYKSKFWIYYDTGEKVQDNKLRKCGHCGIDSTNEGHDGCLGTLTGLMNACCGHGNITEMYIQFLDGSCIRGENAKNIVSVLSQPKKKGELLC